MHKEAPLVRTTTDCDTRGLTSNSHPLESRMTKRTLAKMLAEKYLQLGKICVSASYLPHVINGINYIHCQNVTHVIYVIHVPHVIHCQNECPAISTMTKHAIPA